MKKLLLILSLACGLSGSVFSQGIIFEDGTLNDVLAKAKAENRAVFVDLYTTWCGPCKQMDRNIFSLKTVGDQYNTKFINIKLDGEKGDGLELSKKYKVSAYPAFLFLDNTGDLVYATVGYKTEEEFLNEAQKAFIAAKYGGWDKIRADLETETKNSEFLSDMYNMADEESKPYLLNRYLNSLSDEKLFTVNTGSLISKISVYDTQLFHRLVDGFMKMGDQAYLPEFYQLVVFQTKWKMTEFFRQSIKEGDETLFNQLLKLQEVFGRMPQARDKDIDLHEGRAEFFASPEFLRLCFYTTNRTHSEEFKTLLPDYMEKLMAENKIDTLSIRRKRVLDKVANGPLESIYQWEYSLKHEMTVKALIDWTNYYWRISPSDKKTKQLCAKWLNYACAINPYNPTGALNACRLLVKLGHKKEAIFALEETLEIQKNRKQPDVNVIKKLQDRLEYVHNDKE